MSGAPNPDPFVINCSDNRIQQGGAARPLPQTVLDAPQDEDGFPIPTMWQFARRPSWDRCAKEIRAKWSQVWIEDEKNKAIKQERIDEKNDKKNKKPARAPATRFTTDYAIEWGRSQKKPSGPSWHLIDRERFDYRLKRHHDLVAGSDALFDDGGPGCVAIQGAGRSERKVHWDRFSDWGATEEGGSPAKCRRRGIRFYYLEFDRGNKTPILIERWDLIGDQPNDTKTATGSGDGATSPNSSPKLRI